MKKLLSAFVLSLWIGSVGYCQTQPTTEEKDRICEEQLNFVLEHIKEISHKYLFLANFSKNLSIQKEFISDEAGMYYGLSFINNVRFSMAKPQVIDEKLPYLGINFSLRTGHYNGQADLLNIDEYLKRESLETIQNSFKSGIVIFGQVVSDDELIKTEIYGFFDETIKNILEWEKAQSK